MKLADYYKNLDALSAREIADTAIRCHREMVESNIPLPTRLRREFSSSPIEDFRWSNEQYFYALQHAYHPSRATADDTQAEACVEIFNAMFRDLMSYVEDFLKHRSQKRNSLAEARTLLEGFGGIFHQLSLLETKGLNRALERLSVAKFSPSLIRQHYGISIAALIDVVRKYGGDSEAQQFSQKFLS